MLSDGIEKDPRDQYVMVKAKAPAARSPRLSEPPRKGFVPPVLSWVWREPRQMRRKGVAENHGPGTRRSLLRPQRNAGEGGKGECGKIPQVWRTASVTGGREVSTRTS